MLPQRVWFLTRFGLKTAVDFEHFGLKLGMFCLLSWNRYRCLSYCLRQVSFCDRTSENYLRFYLPISCHCLHLVLRNSQLERASCKNLVIMSSLKGNSSKPASNDAFKSHKAFSFDSLGYINCLPAYPGCQRLFLRGFQYRSSPDSSPAVSQSSRGLGETQRRGWSPSRFSRSLICFSFPGLLWRFYAGYMFMGSRGSFLVKATKKHFLRMFGDSSWWV